MLLFLRDADVVDEWLRTQQAANTTATVDEQVDLETCEKEIHDLEKRQGKRARISLKPREETEETFDWDACPFESY